MSVSLKMMVIGVIGLALQVMAIPAHAGMEAFKDGSAIKGYGQIAKIESQLSIPKDMVFKVAFDMSKAAKPGEVNRNLNTLARFINMHLAVGVKAENIQLAMVVHGASVADLAKDSFYQGQLPKELANKQLVNANKDLVEQLVNYGVKIYICGQSAAYYGLDNASLLPGVEMALSAMTAHAVLAQQGYSLNPF
ncbi:DsrE family protein [Shewanella olleyana]|uniref:DsrE family protein n=1 Tax=Shewanella olleyana TaxID=135626 RepID=UPI00201061C1|nr:DsrE family protein [Shewanella olleyana]MCL1067185.1 DsrE family protein [Shewanella olleyana]